MSAVAVSGNHVVVVAQQGNRTDGDIFLARVEMKKAPIFPRL